MIFKLKRPLILLASCLALTSPAVGQQLYFERLSNDEFAVKSPAERVDGEPGTMGELSPKPHPWLYAETSRIGLEMPAGKRNRIVGLEDSAAGVLSIRLAGFTALGISGGNIEQSGMKPLLSDYQNSLLDTLPFILGKK